eukprot:CAMPEP_0119312534 /NCGR_PEP_ID=MMETSP1333-20130426/26820_1 /TAXON_ID=418940 /ORGANISM="Scyphosphaera apsteinii, Strain RCC1455" /LENGTH=379 /DNA_ID=CAMNT_0007317175 /DNA_START=99 /DNA_END=1238 /DNA_ORIENTATION=+
MKSKSSSDAHDGPDLFKFTVMPGMGSGDIIKARTPTGVLLEVTVPDGAVVGDIVQFAVPRAVEAMGAAPDAPAMPAKLKMEEKVNVRDIDEKGVTNATPKMTFSVTVPADARAGQTVVAELPNSERVAVTVPDGAKPGRELHFRVTSAPPETELVDVLMKGFMKKKSPKGLRGLHAWQMRWFELTMTRLSYWEVSMEGAVDMRGSVALNELVGVRVHQGDEERLDLKLKSGRLFQLCAPTKAERDEWAECLQQALVDAVAQIAGLSQRGEAVHDSADLSQDSEAMDEAMQSSITEAEAESEEQYQPCEEESDEIMLRSSSSNNQRTLLGKVQISTESSTNDSTNHDSKEVKVAPVTAAVYMSRMDRARKANAARKSTRA